MGTLHFLLKFSRKLKLLKKLNINFFKKVCALRDNSEPVCHIYFN